MKFEKNTISIIAHRGNGPTSHFSSGENDVPKRFAPENTIKAFQRAMDEDADGVEFDIYISSDGIPVVIHDDELNKNVKGAVRKGRDLGFISKKTLQEIKTYDVGQGERIPTLRETMDFFVNANRVRFEAGKPPVILNVELKGLNTGANSWRLIKEYIDQGKINSADVVYCSFEHNELADIRSLDKDAKLSPAVRTKFLFGEENVITPGWFVKTNTKYTETALKNLNDIYVQLQPQAFDLTLFDIDKQLIDFFVERGLELYASTSDFRDFSNKGVLYFLNNLDKKIPLHFKTDEPAIARSNLINIHNIEEEASLSSIVSFSTEELNTLEGCGLIRLAKPGQVQEKTDHNGDDLIKQTMKILEKIIIKLNQSLEREIKTHTDNTNKMAVLIQAFSAIKPYIHDLLPIKMNTLDNISAAFDEFIDLSIVNNQSPARNVQSLFSNSVRILGESLKYKMDQQVKVNEDFTNSLTFIKDYIFYKDLQALDELCINLLERGNIDNFSSELKNFKLSDDYIKMFVSVLQENINTNGQMGSDDLSLLIDINKYHIDVLKSHGYQNTTIDEQEIAAIDLQNHIYHMEFLSTINI